MKQASNATRFVLAALAAAGLCSCPGRLLWVPDDPQEEPVEIPFPADAEETPDDA